MDEGNSKKNSVIKRIYQSESDRHNLSKFKVAASIEDKITHYEKWVINKPWGYEYLLYQNKQVSLWLLHIKKNHSTSFHAHPQKKTAVLVLDGAITVFTLSGWYDLAPMDGLNINPGVFHASLATSNNGAYVLETETPPLKHDLVRLKDIYGRAGTPYEDTSHYKKRTTRHPYFSLNNKKTSKSIKLSKCLITIFPYTPSDHLKSNNYITKDSVFCCLDGRATADIIAVEQLDLEMTVAAITKLT